MVLIRNSVQEAINLNKESKKILIIIERKNSVEF